jgi:hypothetical protein
LKGYQRQRGEADIEERPQFGQLVSIIRDERLRSRGQVKICVVDNKPLPGRLPASVRMGRTENHMPDQSAITVTFEALKSVLAKYAAKLTVVTDNPDHFSLDAGCSEQWQKTVSFGAVRIFKNYVSFWLMAVYGCPDLLDDLSDDLKKRMQGKSCFNFKTITPAKLRGLKALTKRGFELYKKQR